MRLIHLRRLSWTFSDQALVSGMNMLLGVLLARFLPVGQFGDFTIAWAFVLLSSSLQAAMVTLPMMSIGPKQSEACQARYYGAVFTLQAAFVAGTFLLLWSSIRFGEIFAPHWEGRKFGLALPIAAMAFQYQDFTRRYFFTVGNPIAALVSDVVSYGGQVAVVFALARRGLLDAEGVLWINAGTSILAIVVSAPWLRTRLLQLDGFLETVTRHWHFSKWLIGSAALAGATGNTLLVTAGAVLGASDVGALKAAQNLLGVNNVFFLALGNLLPQQAATRFHHGGPAALIRYVNIAAWGCFLVTLLMSAIFACAPEFWLLLFYGPKYNGYGFLLRWLALAYVLAALIAPLQAGMAAIEQTHPTFWAALLTTLLSIALGVPLMTYCGLHGMLYALLGNQAITILILLYVFRVQIRRMRPLNPATA
jgi:O-antigen/teichoic acid export membrane protein